MNRRPLLLCACAAALVLAAGCTPDAWVTHPMPTPPDRSCRTGGGAGHDVWIWNCVNGQRVVVSQYCGGFVGCSEAEREVVPCGEKAPLEKRLEPYLGEDCQPVPHSQRWP
ncbi:MAG: hypothetical protein JRI23_17910 [Deltaproteobacteria bacterium]|nr:hypothetical protein [Deltaproteobacteria bacterium]MBW2533714.1 hypothetical protein [Deltaproteobacteria bacterium]